MRPTPAYERLGHRIEHLLRQTEERAADMLAAAHRQADQIRATAHADATRIRAAALRPDDAPGPAHPNRN